MWTSYCDMRKSSKQPRSNNLNIKMPKCVLQACSEIRSIEYEKKSPLNYTKARQNVSFVNSFHANYTLAIYSTFVVELLKVLLCLLIVK